MKFIRSAIPLLRIKFSLVEEMYLYVQCIMEDVLLSISFSPLFLLSLICLNLFYFSFLKDEDYVAAEYAV